MSRADLIREILSTRYVCKAIPHGDFTKIAAEVGVSREYVRQIANREGWTGRLHAKDKVSRKVCASCGNVGVRGRSIYCSPCTWVEVPCSYCDKPVRMRVAQLTNRMNQFHSSPNGKTVRYTGRVFCDRYCFGKWAGRNYGTGSANNPIAIKRAMAGPLPTKES